jgi:hypothetical protein
MPPFIQCPSCNEPTKLLIGKIGEIKFKPCCPNCVWKCEYWLHYTDDVFSLYYLPHVERNESGWIIQQRVFDFVEVRRFFDACCEPGSVEDSEKQFLTADFWLLAGITNILKNCATIDFHYEIIRKRLKVLNEIIQGSRVIVDKRLPWRILPPDKRGIQMVIAHLNRLKQFRPDIQLDSNRLHFIDSFAYDEKYQGQDSFEGYIVFYFSQLNIAVLECAYYSNALYILKDKWRYLSMLSKDELLTYHPSKTIRIPHNTAFYNNVENAFKQIGIIRA